VPYCEAADDELRKCRLRNGDLVVARIGATTGKTYLIHDPPEAVFASYLIRIRTRSDLLPDFLNMFTKSSLYLNQVDEAKGGRLKQGVNIPNLQSLLVPVPPLSEQKAIAQVLGTVQRAKEKTGEVIAAARQLKASLMRHLFTYGPVSVQEAEEVDTRQTDYGIVPQAWERHPLDQVATVQTGVAKGRQLTGDDTVTLPYLRVANVQDGYLDLSEMKELTIRRSEVDRYSLKKGDVVLTEGGDFDKLGRGFIWNDEVPKCIHQNHIFAVRANSDIVLPDYLAYMTQSSYGKAYFLSVAHKTTNLACINTTKLKALPALVPDLTEQEEIVTLIRGVDFKISIESRRNEALATLFQSLLHGLMTGTRRVSTRQIAELGQTKPKRSTLADLFGEWPNDKIRQ
jgi:type I restriction enzyme S subunit